MKLGFGYLALRCGCKFYERWHYFSPVSLHSLAFMNDEGRTHMTNCIHKSQNCRSLSLIHCYLAVQGFIDLTEIFFLFWNGLDPCFIPRSDEVWGLNVQVFQDLSVLCKPVPNVWLICSHSLDN